MKALLFAALGLLVLSDLAPAQSRPVSPPRTAQRAMREYVPTDGELIADEIRRLRQEAEWIRIQRERAFYLAQQREYQRQRQLANQRAVRAGRR